MTPVARTWPWAPGFLEGKVAIVTGSASGIGRACAISLAKAGASVIVADIDEVLGPETVEILGPGRGMFVPADVSDAGDVAGMLDVARAVYGRLDIAVNNAGIELAGRQITETDRVDWERVIAVNLTATWACIRAEIPLMLEHGGGSIINMASALGLVALPGQASYIASKHGVVGLTKAAALEFSAHGIRVNAVCPGVVSTPMVDEIARSDPQFLPTMMRMHSIGRIARPEEIADAAVWLASDASSFVTGSAIGVDGGYTAT